MSFACCLGLHYGKRRDYRQMTEAQKAAARYLTRMSTHGPDGERYVKNGVRYMPYLQGSPEVDFASEFFVSSLSISMSQYVAILSLVFCF